MTFALPDPPLLAWAAFNTFVSLSAFVNSRRDSMVGALIFTLFGIISIALLKFQFLNLFMYYELGICLMQVIMALNFLKEGHPSVRPWVALALGRCYLAFGVWFLY